MISNETYFIKHTIAHNCQTIISPHTHTHIHHFERAQVSMTLMQVCNDSSMELSSLFCGTNLFSFVIFAIFEVTFLRA